GRSVLELMKKQNWEYPQSLSEGAEIIEFRAETRMSGLDLTDGRKVRKGAVDAIRKWVVSQGGTIPDNLQANNDAIASAGGTPLAVAVDQEIYGLIYLKDTVKAGMKERFEQMRSMGIKTIMCTGDNPLTAATIAREAG
ncbi:HAD-IC family P-type ATPase, partial [Salmonella enterica subsp. enterica serovar Enteritidis]|nr:HAD-IC family P-type ATPase [Salmonella enterica subsp. enterica serovar Enteritidis]